jgi:hypothetical protein
VKNERREREDKKRERTPKGFDTSYAFRLTSHASRDLLTAALYSEFLDFLFERLVSKASKNRTGAVNRFA